MAVSPKNPRKKKTHSTGKQPQIELDAIYESAPIGLCLIDPDTRFLRVNRQFADMGGFSIEDILGKRVRDLVPELADLLERLTRKVVETGEPLLNLEITGEMPAQPGTIRQWKINAWPLKHARGQVIAINIVVEEITERKWAEEALKEREEQLRNLIERSTDGIILIDEEGHITTWSKGMEKITGIAAQETLGVPAWEVQERIINAEWAGPDHRARYRAVWEKVLREGNYPYMNRIQEVQARSPTGEIRYLQQSVFTVPTQKGFRTGCIMRDVTEMKRAEEALKEYIERLRRSNEDLERFAYISSHDLQEPLRTMVTFTQFLEKRYKGKLDQDADDYIRYIVNGGKRMQSLINDLLEFSRVNTKGIEFRPIDATAIVEEALATLRPKKVADGVSITVDQLPQVIADPGQLLRVFQNLISNALKFRRPDTALEIHISAQQQDGMVQFSVADNGIGIDPEYHDKIFKIFQRLHGIDAYEGTGIGLAIVKRIIDRHGGRIWVESEPGKGSTFHFTIPAAKRD